MSDHRHRGGRPPRRSRDDRGFGDPSAVRGRWRRRIATVARVGRLVRQEPADVGADAAGRVPAGQPAAVDHVAEAGATGSVRGERPGRPDGGPGPVPHGARPEARPGRQHGLVLHQQADARRQTGRSCARVAHAAAARPQLRPTRMQQHPVPVGGHRVAHRPAGPVQGAVHQQSDVVAAVRRARAQSAAGQGVSSVLHFIIVVVMMSVSGTSSNIGEKVVSSTIVVSIFCFVVVVFFF